LGLDHQQFFLLPTKKKGKKSKKKEVGKKKMGRKHLQHNARKLFLYKIMENFYFHA